MADKISIIVPAYNIEGYVEKAVRSILAQTYSELEVILVDDGSTDGTSAILDELAKTDDRIRVIHQENGGVTSARMRGIAEATGEWIGFMDGDDYIEPEMYATLLNNAKKHDADISHCGYQMVFPSRVDYYYNTGRLTEQDRLTGLKDLLAGEFIEPGLCNKLYHNTLFHSLLHSSMMDMTIRNNEDLLMNYYLFREAKKAVYYDFCPYYYMIREGSAATSAPNEHKLSDPLKVFHILEEATAQEPELQIIVRRRLLGQLIGLATMPYDGWRELIEPHLCNARRELREMLPEVLRGQYGAKNKLFALWAAAWPASYGWVHKAYSALRGTDRKYEIR